jgi:predicted transcriptional regulator YheO
VTGRDIESPATNLVLDLKMRRMQNQDKLNYELNIGSRKFKCTTIPIYRENHGLVGAVCINVDVNYLNGEIRNDKAKLDAFIDALCKTDMVLDENILSKDEYEKALAGKRHFRDFVAG